MDYNWEDTWLGIIVWKHQKCHNPSYILSKNERKKNCTQHLWPSMLKFEEFVRRPQALKMPTCKQITMGSKKFLSQSCLAPSGKRHCRLSKGGSLENNNVTWLKVAKQYQLYSILNPCIYDIKRIFNKEMPKWDEMFYRVFAPV